MYGMRVEYPRTEGSKFDMDYYRDSHIPLCERLLADFGHVGTVLHLGAGKAPGGEDLLWASVDILFEDIDQLKAGLAAAGKEIGADVPNYTDVTPRMSFSEVRLKLE
ncbi:EthD family reductase [Parahaliea mediterranea]|uniref:EthD family reductase n=1 Tax=Parahaliea mediterranea TaxID=651086 RepID=UPI000E2FE28B|nr:EthD family reductase [Parahaliea mediterranea]